MNDFREIYIFLLITTSAVGLILGYIAWKRRETQGAIPLAILMLSISIWSFFQVITLFTQDFDVKIIHANLRFLGIQVVPIAFYALAWEYKHRTKTLGLRRYLKIMIFPAVIFVAIWTNPLHHRFYTYVYMQDGILMMRNGLLLWVNMIYLYFFIVAGIYLFIKSYQNSQSKHRQQAFIILIAAFVPLFSNLIFNLIPSMRFDLTPLSFSITGLLFYYALFYYGLLDLVPVARDMLVEEMEDILILLDNNHRILDMNKKARQFILQENAYKADYVGVSIYTLTEHWRELSEAIGNAEVIYARVHYIHGEQRIYFDLNKSVLHDKKGVKLGEIVALRNITDLEEALLEAKYAREAAEKANRSKGYFLANMSHEIRTPMNAIIGIAEMIDSQELSKAEQSRYNQIIIKSAESLLAIINDILDLSKVESGKLELEKTAINVEQIVRDTIEVFGITIANRPITLKCEIDPKLPGNLVGDSVRIRQILMNLIGNAIKFTKKGSICVAVEYINNELGMNNIEFVISDTGLGIPEEKLETIFESFKQADSSTTREYGGTGLGLSIVKSLVELMGGTIRVESKLGEGSKFIVMLPLETDVKAIEANIESKPFEHIDVSGLKLLVAEDNNINREIIGLHLKKLGCEYEVVENGKLAVEGFKKGCFDAILMDIQMPEMDGLEAAAIIRSLELTSGNRIPMIALTASAMKEDIEKCMAAGMDAHLSKPIRADKLRTAIVSVIINKQVN